MGSPPVGDTPRGAADGRALQLSFFDDLGLTVALGGHGKLAQCAVQTQHLLDQLPAAKTVVCTGGAGSLEQARPPGRRDRREPHGRARLQASLRHGPAARPRGGRAHGPGDSSRRAGKAAATIAFCTDPSPAATRTSSTWSALVSCAARPAPCAWPGRARARRGRRPSAGAPSSSCASSRTRAIAAPRPATTKAWTPSCRTWRTFSLPGTASAASRSMAERTYALVPVVTGAQWSAFHAIRRKVLFEGRQWGACTAPSPPGRPQRTEPSGAPDVRRHAGRGDEDRHGPAGRRHHAHRGGSGG